MLHCDYDAGAVGPFVSVLLDLLTCCFLVVLCFCVLFISLCVLDNATVTMMLVQSGSLCECSIGSVNLLFF